MKIGIVTTWFERGAAYVSRAYLEALKAEHDVYIYARAGEKYAMGDPRWDLPMVTWGKRVRHRLDTYVDWRDFDRWVRTQQLDLLLFNEQQSWDVILRLRRAHRLLLGAYIDYYQPDTVPFFRLYDFLLCNTKRHYSVFREHPQALYLPWGTDLTLFTPSPARPPGDGVIFFTSCGMDPYRKGTDLTVQAFARVTGKASLLIHDQHAIRTRMPELIPLIERDPRIRLLSAEVNAPGLYHEGDVYVYPSRLDGLGLTLAEALACGLPVITTDCPPMNEFVREGDNGRLVAVEALRRRDDNYYWPEAQCEVASLAAAMQWYVDHQQELPQLRTQARAYAEAQLDWQQNAAPLGAWLESIHPLAAREWQDVYPLAAHYEQRRHQALRCRELKNTLRPCADALGVLRLKRWLKG